MKNVGTAMNKVETIHEELDFRFSKGKELLERFNLNAGVYENNKGIVSSKSKSCERSLTSNKDWKEVIRSLSVDLEYLRFAELKIQKNISIENKLLSEVAHKRYYIEIIKAEQTFSTLVSSKNDVMPWLSQISEYLNFPEYPGNPDADLINLTPETFGYLLHEGLGHRHESDDYPVQYSWKKFSKTNFDVFDSPGESNWYGYCPYGDDGTLGKRVKLFCGKTGLLNLLSHETGNLRMVSYHFHPIVRQRCLIVKRAFTSNLPQEKRTLSILAIEKGLFNNEKLELHTSMQIIEIEGKKYRLPKLKIEIGVDEILKFSSYGKSFLSEPASGCKKGYQGQLPISFFSTSAWAKLDDLIVKIGAL